MSLMPNCKEVHRLISESLDRDLSPMESVRARVHLWMCSACTNFGSQMLLIRRATRALPIPDQTPDRDADSHESPQGRV